MNAINSKPYSKTLYHPLLRCCACLRSLAASLRVSSRTLSTPMYSASAQSESDQRIARVFMASPLGLRGLRPCPRSLGGRVGAGFSLDMSKMIVHMQKHLTCFDFAYTLTNIQNSHQTASKG